MSGKRVTMAERLANFQTEVQTERSLRLKAEADAKKWEERFDALLKVTLDRLTSRYGE